jgi:hypothetical protein
MQLSASPASIAPLSTAFIAPEQSAVPVAGAPADFAQVFANLGAGAVSPAPVVTSAPLSGGEVSPAPVGKTGPQGPLPAPAAAPTAAPECPAAALTCANVRTLYLPATPPTTAVVPGQTMAAPAVAGATGEISSEEAPGVFPGQAQVRLPSSGRKSASTRGEAVPSSAPRAKSTSARPGEVQDAAVAVTPPVAESIVVLAAAAAVVPAPAVSIVAQSSSAATTNEGQDAPLCEPSATPAEVLAVALPSGREAGTETNVPQRARKPQSGAVRRHGNSESPVAGPARWITPAAGKPVARVAAAPGQAEPIVANGAGEGALPAVANPVGVPEPTPEAGRVPVGQVLAELSPVVPQDRRAAGETRTTIAASVSNPAVAEPAVAHTAAPSVQRQVAGEIGERANVIPVPAEAGRDRAAGVAQEAAALPFAVEADVAAEPNESPSATVLPEADGLDFAAPILTASTWSRTPPGVAVPAPVAGRSVYPTENIAGRLNKTSQAADLESATPLKHIESSSGESLTGSKPMVGTHVAKAQGFMPHAPSIPAALDASLPSRAEFFGSEAVAMSPALEVENPTPAAMPVLAGKAVEAVLEAADRLATGDRSSVRLEFAMGESELSVRVALRDNAVRATFLTDSPELRAALVHEWQAVSAETGERTFQFAPPTFQSASGDSGSQGALTGEFSRQSRDGQPQHAGEFAFAGLPGGRRGADSRATPAADPGRERAELPAYSQHLHTHA